MLEIERSPEGAVTLAGRFDASQADRARPVFDALTGRVTVDMRELAYISSLGLGVLLQAQKRLKASGGGLRLVNVNRHIYDIFTFSGFHHVFEIERADG